MARSPQRTASPRPAAGPGAGASLLALHVAVLLFGAAGLFGSWVAAHPIVIVFARVLVASIAFTVLLWLRPVRTPRATRGQRVGLWLCGGVLALHWVAFFQSIRLSSVAVGLLAYSTAPVFVVLMEPLWLPERLSRRALACALVSVGGVALIVPRWALEAAGFQGVAWGVLSGFSFAVLVLLNRGLVRNLPAIRVARSQDAVALLLLAPLVPMVASPLTAPELAFLLALGLVCTALAHTLFIQSMARLRARAAALASALEPVYGIALAWLLLGEVPAARTLAGGALVLAAVLGATLRPEPAA